MTDYAAFIASKFAVPPVVGIDVEPSDLHPLLFPHQRDLTRWALRKGRAAIFADTGLGKTLMELEWAQHVGTLGRVLMLTPLAVAQQIVAEARRFNLAAEYLREDDGQSSVAVTNYELLHRFDPAHFVGIVLDESSILKAYDGATRTTIIEAFRDTPYRLAATATPAPNDFTELGNHAEFLGVKTRAEMLSEYFVHDGGKTADWRLKGHAVTSFWRWVASWGAVISSPADLGHDDTLFRLPPLEMREHVLESDVKDAHAVGLLFPDDARTLNEQRAVRRATMDARMRLVADLASGIDPAIVWCELNDEADMAEEMIAGAVQVQGSDDPDTKAQHLLDFAAGHIRVLVTKPSIAGHGMNFQRCARMIFVGASHSYEQTYQAIRRCWRFGQTRPVEVHVIRMDVERMVIENYRRKEAEAARLALEMRAQVLDQVRAEVCGGSTREWNEYKPDTKLMVPPWL